MNRNPHAAARPCACNRANALRGCSPSLATPMPRTLSARGRKRPAGRARSPRRRRHATQPADADRPVAQSGNERSCHRLPPAKRSGVVGPEGFLRIGVTRLEVHARDTTQRSAAAGTGSRASVSAVTREPLDQAETRRPCNRTAHCSNRWKEQSERAEPSSLRWLVRNESEAPESGGVRRHRHARIRSEASALRARRGLPLPPGSLARSLLAPGAPTCSSSAHRGTVRLLADRLVRASNEVQNPEDARLHGEAGARPRPSGRVLVGELASGCGAGTAGPRRALRRQCDRRPRVVRAIGFRRKRSCHGPTRPG